MLIVAILIIFLTGLFLYVLFPIIQVSGDSMMPTFRDGKYLLSCRLFHLEIGRVYVYRVPLSGKIVIKRLVDIKDNECYFVGDNKRVSFDSRAYGYVPKENIISIIL